MPGEAAKEMALHVMDILKLLADDLPLCYLAIENKCFEFLQSRAQPSDLQLDPVFGPHSSAIDAPVEDENDAEDDDEDDVDDEDEDADEDEDEQDTEDDSETEGSVVSQGGQDGSEEEPYSCVRMDLREILFYDDKVAIFKARHGRL